MSFRLKCQPCGAEQEIDGPDPSCAFDLMKAAQVAGWLSYNNNVAPGIVIFCSHACCRAALTKNGFFRRDLGRGRMRALAR